jgi:general secretion pathway protein A
VFRRSGGTPRLINIVCDRALLFGYVAESREISGRMVKAAIAEIRREDRQGGLLRRRTGWLIVPALLAGAVAFAALHRGTLSPPQPGNGTGWTAAAEIPRLLEKELGGKDESESALAAFNALAKRWNVPPVVAAPGLKFPRDMADAAARRGLTLTRFSGNLGLLVRMGYPALLEFTLPGVAGKRYLALTGMDQGRFQVAPPLSGRDSLTSAELESCWSGIAWLPWKNFSAIPPLLAPGTRGEEAARLQRLLQGAQQYNGRITGVFDPETVAAIRGFQAARGIAPDGKAGAQTLLLLYRTAGKFPAPGLEQTGGGEKR